MEAPAGFLQLGPLLYPALDPARRPQRAVTRGALPTYRVLRDLVQEGLDGGGRGSQALFDLGIATSIAVLHMLREAGRQVGKTPREIADTLTGSVSPDVADVFTAVLDTDPDALADPLEAAADDNLERFMDLVLDLADVAAVLAVGIRTPTRSRGPSQRGGRNGGWGWHGEMVGSCCPARLAGLPPFAPPGS